MLHMAEYVAPYVGLEQDVEHCLFKLQIEKYWIFQ